MKDYAKVLLVLLLPLAAVLGYAMWDGDLGLGLTKVDLSGVLPPGLTTSSADRAATAAKTGGAAADGKPDLAGTALQAGAIDSTHQRILFFGDSMVEGLAPRMAQYAAANGHDLLIVCWYSSTTELWATDTLRHFLREAKPTHIMVTIGGNEQEVRDVKKREDNIKSILADFGDVPFTWICTPAWNKEANFNTIPEALAGPGRFYDSRRLTLTRGADHHHPTLEASAVWMDSIAAWMESPQSAHPIAMKRPSAGGPKAGRGIFMRSPSSIAAKGGTPSWVTEYGKLKTDKTDAKADKTDAKTDEAKATEKHDADRKADDEKKAADEKAKEEKKQEKAKADEDDDKHHSSRYNYGYRRGYRYGYNSRYRYRRYRR